MDNWATRTLTAAIGARTAMNFTEYEHHVADVLRDEGWEATHIGKTSCDGGIDVIADRDGERLAVQVKMFNARRIAPRAIRELAGAATEQDCDSSMIVTPGGVQPNARVTAKKLGVEIRIIPQCPLRAEPYPTAGGEVAFDDVWVQIKALEETQITDEKGRTNTILRVDGDGITRITSQGNKGLIPIEVLRWTIDQLLAGTTVTQVDINEHSRHQASSGVVRLLASLPSFERTKVGPKIALRRVPRPAVRTAASAATLSP